MWIELLRLYRYSLANSPAIFFGTRKAFRRATKASSAAMHGKSGSMGRLGFYKREVNGW